MKVDILSGIGFLSGIGLSGIGVLGVVLLVGVQNEFIVIIKTVINTHIKNITNTNPKYLKSLSQIILFTVLVELSKSIANACLFSISVSFSFDALDNIIYLYNVFLPNY